VDGVKSPAVWQASFYPGFIAMVCGACVPVLFFAYRCYKACEYEVFKVAGDCFLFSAMSRYGG